ncbi:succinyl-diaminopimelate desuccinylase [Stomatohabitans albus]|uniref:succinyl-diaminopimelate desuccinylase n=1 Tax=Stomatohabitans albus TaxID=3110766 RepID=UPI00300D3970
MESLSAPVTEWSSTGDDLIDLIGELLIRPCVTGDEGLIADWIAQWAASRGDMVMRVGHSLVMSPPGDLDDPRPVVALVGHTDVVPPTEHDRLARLEERDGQPVIVGRGVSDMKAGLGVLMQAFIDEDCRNGPYRMVLVAYAGEEGPAEANELAQVLNAVPGLADTALAIIGEPTDGQVQLGCMGALHALVTFPGVQAHSARPWQGHNALTHAGEWLAKWKDVDLVEVTIDGLTWKEVMTPTQAYTDNARNIVPGSFVVNVNYRFAPDKTIEEAEAQFIERINAFWTGDEPLSVAIVDRALPCPPRRNNAMVSALIDAFGVDVAPKQAWTDVARFNAIGVPALNFSPAPGDQAHQAGEWMPVADIRPGFDQLKAFLTHT